MTRRPSRAKLIEVDSPTADHGELIALAGGPADGHWYWTDWYAAQPPDAYCRAGYARTEETTTNPDRELRKLGPGTVWRYDPASVPPRTPGRPAQKADYGRCGCGERLLLPGRDRCERCRLGRPTEAVWRYEEEAGHLAGIETARQDAFRRGVAARLAEVGISAECAHQAGEDEIDEPASPDVSGSPVRLPQPAAAPAPLVDLWPIIARGYDR